MRRIVAVLVAGIAFAPARAQQRPPREVPYEFAAALLGNDPSPKAAHHAPQMYVGTLAPPLRGVPTPRGTHIVGSLVWTASSVAFFQTAAPPDSVRARYAEALQAAGWQPPPPLPPPTNGGFRDAASAPSLETFCRDSLTLNVRYLPTDDGGTRVRVQQPAPGNASPCRPSAPTVFAYSHQPRFPLLLTPAAVTDASIDSCGRARFNDGPGTGRTYRTSLSTATMLADYARQLADSGWTAGESVSGEVLVQRFTKLDSLGRTRTLTLSISTQPGAPACRQAMMYMRDPQ